MRLFPCDLIGRGSDEIESLPSYLQRLAACHGVTVGRLFRELRYHANDTSKRPRVGSLAALVRPNDRTASCLQILQNGIVSEGIRSSTFLALRGTFHSTPRNTFARQIRWCPKCLESDRKYGEPYLRLAWSLSDYRNCRHHGMPLIDACPQCGAHQNSTRLFVEFDRCRSCSADLARVPPWHRFLRNCDLNVYDADLLEIVREISRNPDLDYARSAASGVLELLFNRVWALQDERRFWELVPRDESIHACCGGQLSLPLARRLAYRLNVSLHGLLSGHLQAWTRQLDPAWLETLPVNLAPKPRKVRHDRVRLITQLDTARRSKPPLPLRQYARKIGVSTGCLEYHAPQLCRSIKQSYRQHRAALAQKKQTEAHLAVLQYAASHRGTASRKGALREIRRQTGLPKNLLRSIIAQTIAPGCAGGQLS